MAATPYHVFSPLVFLSIIGLLRGEREGAGRRGRAGASFTLDAVVAAENQGATIALALAALARQTRKPRKVFVVDDASRDDTVEAVKAFARLDELDLVLIERKDPQGQTAALRQIARFSDAEAVFVLDGDTVLESPDYIESVAAELMRNPDHASASGFVRPLRLKDRRRAADWAELKRLAAAAPGVGLYPAGGPASRLTRGLTTLYSDVLHYFFQNIVCLGELNLFGTLINPLGQAAAFRRRGLLEVFEEAETPGAGKGSVPDQITVNHSLMNRGFRHVQALNVQARCFEPGTNRPFKQLYAWSTSWLASSYYFPELVIGPFRAVQRRHARKDLGLDILNEEVFVPYQEPLKNLAPGASRKPAGWAMFVGVFDKTAYPLMLILFAASRWWAALGYVVLAETLLYAVLLGVFGKDNKFEFTLKAFVTTPLRYLSIYTDMVTIGRFVTAHTRLAEAAAGKPVAPVP